MAEIVKDFVIITETTSDLPKEYVAKEQIHIVGMEYTIDLKTYGGSTGNELSPHEFYEKMKAGGMATTALVNPLTAQDAMEKYLKQGKGVLYLAFSSGLSGSCQSAITAGKELEEKYPGKVAVLDTLAASMGQGLLVYHAVQYKKSGHDLRETAAYIEDLRHRLCHYFTVNDLFHLYRGGRVTKSKAIVGSILKIKPLLHVDLEGHLIPLKNVIGRKKSLIGLVDRMEEKTKGVKNDMVFISHGDCIEDAEFVKKAIAERFGIKNFMISDIGPVIGSHSGPETVALFFIGTGKAESN